MGLGTNRDYKTRDRLIRRNLLVHKMLMTDYKANGLSPAEADSKAFRDVSSMSSSEKDRFLLARGYTKDARKID